MKGEEMKSDNEIRKDLEEIDSKTVDVVCDMLRQYSKSTTMYLAKMVASLCDVELNDMLNDTKHLQNSHARWLFWYAYRYMTNENYDSISKKTCYKRKFTIGSVGDSINKMSMMIEQNPIWAKRWSIIKRVIKAILYDSNEKLDKQQSLTVKVLHPKDVNIKLQVIQ